MTLKYVLLCFLIFNFIIASCSKSGHRRSTSNQQYELDQQATKYETPVTNSNGSNVLNMRVEGGVRIVPVEINGIMLDFIFDTGAGDIGISSAEALVLVRQGTLDEEDILGVQQYQIANGDIVEGTVVNLRKVKLGSRTLYNVRASVIDNPNAPLLLGQSALEQFGRITIDNVRNEIILE